ncbi:MAG: alpha/beta hydrolase [Bacteroidota bacterium]
MDWDKKYGFSIQKLLLTNDYEGKVEATLISRNAKKESRKAVLYIHGFVDYFYQNNLADWANELDINFYALDLRKHGRSLLPHQKPNMTRSMSEYYEEIDKAIDIIRNKSDNNFLILMGHSTGGLISSLYAHKHKTDNIIDAIILNSPFFDMNKPAWFKKTALPLTAFIGKQFPDIPSPEGLKEGYAKSLHKDHNGDWDFNLDHKPILGFKINLGWVAAIHYAQQELQNGLDISCPVLVMYSSKSVTPGNYNPSMHTADSVLNVDDISKYADAIGNQITKVEIKDGIHDLVLSKKEVRDEVFIEMTTFVENILHER